jgi:ABC-type spermidine/putrescine transport system permease subunit I
MRNIDKAKVWLLKTIKFAMYGAAIGILCGVCIAVFSDEHDRWMAVPLSALTASFIASCVAFAVFAWHLFLHMVGQVASSIRGDDESRFHRHSPKNGG